MHTRRALFRRSARVAALLAMASLLPAGALAFDRRRAFDAETMAELMKVLGAGRPTESKDVTLTADDLVENGAARQHRRRNEVTWSPVRRADNPASPCPYFMSA